MFEMLGFWELKNALWYSELSSILELVTAFFAFERPNAGQTAAAAQWSEILLAAITPGEANAFGRLNK